MVLPNETLLDVFACVDYATVVSLLYSPFSSLVRDNWDKVARRRYYIIKASGVRTDDLSLEVREWLEKNDTCVVEFDICRIWEGWEAVAGAIRVHPVVQFTLNRALSLASFYTLTALLPRLAYAERLTIEGYRRFRRRDIRHLLDGFITHFKNLQELQLVRGDGGYFSASCLHFLCDERILRIPKVKIRLHASYQVDQEKEDIVYRFCFDFSGLPETERKTVDIKAHFSNDFCRRIVQVCSYKSLLKLE